MKIKLKLKFELENICFSIFVKLIIIKKKNCNYFKIE